MVRYTIFNMEHHGWVQYMQHGTLYVAITSDMSLNFDVVFTMIKQTTHVRHET